MPVRGSLCLFWRETHTKGMRVRLPTRPEEDEGRQSPRAEQKKGVNRRGQSTEQGSQQGRAVNRNRRKPTVKEMQLLGPVDPEAVLANVRGWVSIPGGCEGISLECRLAIAYRCTESFTKVSQTSLFLALGANPSPWLFVLLFFYFSIMYVVFGVLKCPGSEIRKTTR